MSRIAESIKALKLERREVAAKLSRIDRLIGGFEALNQLQPRRARNSGNGARPVAKAAARRRRTKKPVARAANLAAAATGN